MGRFTMSMFAALGELEVESIRERVQAGLDYARTHGTQEQQGIGKPKRVFNRDRVVE
jgi:DNA invertase Pin-like site-specific DNA recombinase